MRSNSCRLCRFLRAEAPAICEKSRVQSQRSKGQLMDFRMLLLAVAVASSPLVAVPAEAKSCFKKASVGTAVTEGLAKFQVDAALLQATDWSIYFTYISGNGTPGYTFGPRTYRCAPGGVGWECHGSATLCKR